MIGYRCDGPGCRRFEQMGVQYSMFGGAATTPPPGWITWTQQEKPPVSAGLFGVTQTQEEPKMPPTFCSEVCCRDYLRAKTLIEGPAAQ